PTGKTTPVWPPGQSRFDIGDIGVLPDVHPHVPTVNPGEPADRAGIKPGDVILPINGQRITFRPELREAIVKHPGQPISMSILRAGAPMEISVTPDRRGD